MNYSWTQFFIAISILVALYYVIVYVLFFLRKKPSYNSSLTKTETKNNFIKNAKKNYLQTNMQAAATATTLIDTKVISDDYFKTEDDFVINESINQNYVDENGVLQDKTISIINNSHAQGGIINEVDKIGGVKINVSQTNDDSRLPHNDDKIDLSEITKSENFIKEDMINSNESYSTIVHSNEPVLITETTETKSNFITQNINSKVANEAQILGDTILHENKTIITNQAAEEKYFRPTIKPQQMQSLLHLVQKK